MHTHPRYIIMVVLVGIMMADGCAPGESQVIVSLCGVGTVLLSTFAAYGLCMAFGVPFTQLQQILPFILVGIGVDDMFIINQSLKVRP